MPAVQAREGTKPCGVRGPKLNRVKSVEEREKDAGARTQPRRNGGRKNPVPGVVSPDSSLLSASLLARVTAQTVTFRSLSLPAQHGAKAPAGGGGAAAAEHGPAGARPRALHPGLFTEYAVLSLHGGGETTQ